MRIQPLPLSFLKSKHFIEIVSSNEPEYVLWVKTIRGYFFRVNKSPDPSHALNIIAIPSIGDDEVDIITHDEIELLYAESRTDATSGIFNYQMLHHIFGHSNTSLSIYFGNKRYEFYTKPIPQEHFYLVVTLKDELTGFQTNLYYPETTASNISNLMAVITKLFVVEDIISVTFVHMLILGNATKITS